MPVKMTFKFNANSSTVTTTPRQVRVKKGGDRQIQFIAPTSNGSQNIRVGFVSLKGAGQFDAARRTYTLKPGKSKTLKIKGFKNSSKPRLVALRSDPIFLNNGDDADIIIDC